MKQYQIYFLKRHLELLKTITTIKNNESIYKKAEEDLRSKMNIPKTTYHMETDQIEGVQNDDQSESTAKGGESTRDLHNQMIRDRKVTVTRSLDEREEGHALTSYQGENELGKMEREELRLLKLLKEKSKRREAEMVRRKARIEHLRQLIDDLSDTDEIPSEEERRIEDEIEEAQRLVNSRNENRTRFRVTEEITDRYDNEVATFDATINVKTDPTRMRADKQALMITLVIKNRELRVVKKLLGDADMENTDKIQYKIPMLQLSETIRKTQSKGSAYKEKTDEEIERRQQNA